MRGPLALPNPYTGRPVKLRRRPTRAEAFERSVHEALERVRRSCPQALLGVEIAVQEVPVVGTGWDTDEVPLAMATEPGGGAPARVVLFRRPIEHRAEDAVLLALLVHGTLVEQLAVVTGIDVDVIDPPTGDSD